jgi:hypothetical protein
MKCAASKDNGVSSEPSNGVKKAKKVGTTNPTTADLASVGATEPASDRVELHNDVALQQQHAKSKDVKKTSDTEAQQLNNVAPASEPTKAADDRNDEDYDSEEDVDESYDHGLERDPDQSGGLAMAGLFNVNELANNDWIPKQDDEFDEYVENCVKEAIHGDMRLASESNNWRLT